MNLPTWLTDALREHPPQGPVDAGDAHDLPRPGDLRWAAPMDRDGGGQRLVLVEDVHLDHGYVEVVLTTPMTDYATDLDLVLPAAESGLPFSVAAQSDIRGALWVCQLGPRVGAAKDVDLQMLSALYRGRVPTEQSHKRGLPLLGESDPRWDFKKHEIDDLQRLAADCTADLLSDRRKVALVDPRLLDPETYVTDGAIEALLFAARRIVDGTAEVPSWVADVCQEQLQAGKWRRGELHDARRVLERAMNSVLHASGPLDRPPPPESAKWSPAEPRAKEHVLSHVVSSVVESSSVHVITTSALWNAGERRLPHALTLETHERRYQVLVDEPA